MFRTRLITALVLLPVFASALLWLPNGWWAVFLGAWIAVGAWEWGALAGYAGRGRAGYCAAVVALYAVSTTLAPAQVVEAGWWISVAFWAIVVPMWLARGWRITSGWATAGTGFVVLVPCTTALVALQVSPLSLLALMAIVWIADSAAYCAGRLFGRRKLAPSISPGKTWEGVAGGLVAVGIYYFINHVVAGDVYIKFSGVAGLAVFLVIAVASIEGDLFESWLKRQAGVKDSGKLLPGHGGVLDRIDGLTSSMPLAALAVAILG